MLASGKASDEVIDYLANTLTNRLLHAPTQALRHASESAEPDLAQALTRLLAEERGRQ
jgi:glutamyl-tRNA reductase